MQVSYGSVLSPVEDSTVDYVLSARNNSAARCALTPEPGNVASTGMQNCRKRFRF